jgi:hypothetical protein
MALAIDPAPFFTVALLVSTACFLMGGLPQLVLVVWGITRLSLSHADILQGPGPADPPCRKI